MPSWKWTAASQRGVDHIQTNERRQDAHRILTANGVLIAIACDGAGSASYGRHGAAITARTLTSRAQQHVMQRAVLPTPEDIGVWVEEARQLIETFAKNRDLFAGDFATTVVMAISDGRSTTTAHIGDGAVVAREAGSQSLCEFSWPESGEHVSTTFFLTDPVPQLRIAVLNDTPVDRLALFTDGLERLALDFRARIAHRPFFDVMFGAIVGRHALGRDQPLSAQLARYLDTDIVNARTGDDKTLILAAFE